MAVSKKNYLIMTAVIIIVMLVLMFVSLVWLRPWWFKMKDGSVVIPDPLTVFPETTSQSAEMPSEGLTFKGTFNWEEKDGIRDEDKSTCYLWIHTIDDGTMAKFSFGEYLVDGWPVFLVTHTGEQYVFESSDNSLVERVRIIVDVTDTGMSGTIENITPEISNFVRGSFTGESISYELYSVEVLN